MFGFIFITMLMNFTLISLSGSACFIKVLKFLIEGHKKRLESNRNLDSEPELGRAGFETELCLKVKPTLRQLKISQYNAPHGDIFIKFFPPQAVPFSRNSTFFNNSSDLFNRIKKKSRNLSRPLTVSILMSIFSILQKGYSPFSIT